ncbi:rhomboid family protein [Sorangium cellulosum]|uniref:Rhomboid family protein n=1 Tax=Sorangium cellulosum TaxID=56 RepID=A0A2L0EMM4_SORCE|nr:rhomboid family intramembrane serine protease [Sorangium cellulosum]AUX40525.1 rhomboid family protein [Sorangium cellulosum]
MSTPQGKSITRELKVHAALLGGFIALLWAIEIVDFVVFRGSLDRLGIRPRTVPGLVGIALAPLLHGGFAHLVANTVPFLALGWLILLRKTSDLFLVSFVAALVGGLGVWLTGSATSVHIGASGVIFGYFGFLLLRGWFERSALSIALSAAVGLLYGGMIWGVLPTRPGISWEGHLFGFLGGVLAARLIAGRLRRRAEASRRGALLTRK